MLTLSQDARYALRSLRKAPGFTSLAILVLAVGIGATSAIFSLVDSAIIRPLPFADPDALVMLWEAPPGYAHNRVSPLNFADWTAQNQAFATMAAVSGGGRTLTSSSGAAERVPGQSVTAAFFDVLGITPVAGRTFVPADAILQPNVVVVSERFARSHLGGNADALGRVLLFDGQPFTVIGIVPADFRVLYPSDIWTPYLVRRTPEQRRQHYMQVIARLKPGTTIENARADMALVASDIARVAPETNKGWTVTIEPLREALINAEFRSTSMILGGVVAFVLLMASANVANLLLARGIGRAREMAVRSALGGSARQILRLLLTESVLLAALGGAAGLALSWAALASAAALIPPGLLPEGVRLQFDARVTLFAAALTCLTGVLCGLAPAWHGARTSPSQALASGGRGSTGGAGRIRNAIAVGEVAVAVLLCSGASLLIRTLVSITGEDPGFRADSVLTMAVSLPISRYPTQTEVLAFYRNLEPALAALPGVRSVGLTSNLPLDGWDIGQPVEVVGDPPSDPSNRRSAHYQMISPAYFETLGIQMVKGRAFNDHDTAANQPVCIVNEEFVRRHLKGRDPLDATVRVPAMAPGQAPTIARAVVGVIRQVAIEAGEKEHAPEIYVPLEQNAWYSTAIALRTSGSPLALAPLARAAVTRLDKDEPVTRVRTMEDVAAESTLRPRSRAWLVGTFALLALTLAAVGVFGVLTSSVRERVREFGIRRALGARTGDVMRLVLGSGARITGVGVTIGLVAAAVLTRTLSSLLFGVTPLDPVTFLTAPALLAIAALVACAAPALRAARVDPAVILRQE